MRVPTIAAFLALSLMPILPLAAAQGPPITLDVQVMMDQVDDPLMPETETATGFLWARLHVPAGMVCLQPLSVAFSLREWPAYANVFIENPKQDLVVQPSPMPQTYDVKSLFHVGVERDAPAYHDGMYKFRAELFSGNLQQGCLPQAGQAEATQLIKNDYMPGIKVGDATVSHDGLFGKIFVPVTSYANGPTRVRVQFEGTDMKLFEQVNVNELLLESRPVSGSSAVTDGTIVVSYLLDGVEAAMVNAQIVGAHDVIISESSEVDARFLAVGELPTETEPARPASVDEQDAAALPGPGVSVLLLVAATLLALVRRRLA